jgi:hypothetical protein
MGIERELAIEREDFERLRVSLQGQAEKLFEAHRRRHDSILARHGRRRCPDCAGTGAIEKMDAGYMRRFGLREWNGCERCGSTRRDQRGCGHVEA